MAKATQSKKPEDRPVDADHIWAAIESGLEEKVDELCKAHDDLGIILLELAPQFRHMAVTIRHKELNDRWDSMDDKEKIKRSRAFCHKWVEVKGITTFKGVKMDLDYIGEDYRGEVDPEEV